MDASPNRISFDRHSTLTDFTQHSKNAFKFRLRAGSRCDFTSPDIDDIPK